MLNNWAGLLIYNLKPQAIGYNREFVNESPFCNVKVFDSFAFLLKEDAGFISA